MSLSPAAVQAQLTALVSTYGETITLDRGGDNRTVKIFLEPANANVIATYFDDNTAVGLIRPVVQVFFDATMSGTNPGGGTGPQPGNSAGPPQVLDTFTRDGTAYALQRVQFHRLADTVVLITALAAPTA